MRQRIVYILLVLNIGRVLAEVCHASCSTCTGTTKSDCTECKYKEKSLLIGGECIYEGSCDLSCSKCYGPGRDECVSCINNMEPTSEGKCYGQTCKTQGCQSCDFYDVELCLQCKTGYTLQGDGSCKANAGECYMNCEECTSPEQNQCTKCKSNYMLWNNKCIYSDQCASGCVSCVGPEMKDCLLCNENAYQQNKDCPYRCDIEGCRQCDFYGGICYECNEGYIIQDEQCIKKECHDSCSICEEGNPQRCMKCGKNQIYQNSKCIYEGSCDQTCYECYGPDSDTCYSCAEGYKLYNGMCLKDTGCSDNCEMCQIIDSNNKTICQKCKIPYILSVNGECMQLQPGLCSPYCLSCNYSNSWENCVTCSKNRTQYQGIYQFYEAANKSALGSIVKQYTDNISTCILGQQQCGGNCLKCLSPEQGKCIQCKEKNDEGVNIYLYEGYCVRTDNCHESCSVCYGDSASECSLCSEGYTKTETGYCVKKDNCSELCDYCVNSEYDQCATCKTSYEFYQGISNLGYCSYYNGCNQQDTYCQSCRGQGIDQCLKCQAYLQPSIQGCTAQSCSSNCLTCSQSNDELSCIRCADNTNKNILDNNICLYNGTDCYTGCETCSLQNIPDTLANYTCFSCQDTYQFIPYYKFSSGDQMGLCKLNIQCHYSCTSCNGTLPNQCLSCLSSATLLNGYCQIPNASCSSNCQECFGTKFNECSLCDETQYIYNQLTFTCESKGTCAESCEKCFGPISTQCISCKPGRTLIDNYCQVCNVEYCTQCVKGNEKQCKNCEGNRYFDNKQQICAICPENIMECQVDTCCMVCGKGKFNYSNITNSCVIGSNQLYLRILNPVSVFSLRQNYVIRTQLIYPSSVTYSVIWQKKVQGYTSLMNFTAGLNYTQENITILSGLLVQGERGNMSVQVTDQNKNSIMQQFEYSVPVVPNIVFNVNPRENGKLMQTEYNMVIQNWPQNDTELLYRVDMQIKKQDYSFSDPIVLVVGKSKQDVALKLKLPYSQWVQEDTYTFVKLQLTIQNEQYIIKRQQQIYLDRVIYTQQQINQYINGNQQQIINFNQIMLSILSVNEFLKNTSDSVLQMSFCDSNVYTCGQHGTCKLYSNTTMQYRCQCQQGYIGQFCDQSVDASALKQSKQILQDILVSTDLSTNNYQNLEIHIEAINNLLMIPDNYINFEFYEKSVQQVQKIMDYAKSQMQLSMNNLVNNDKLAYVLSVMNSVIFSFNKIKLSNELISKFEEYKSKLFQVLDDILIKYCVVSRNDNRLQYVGDSLKVVGFSGQNSNIYEEYIYIQFQEKDMNVPNQYGVKINSQSIYQIVNNNQPFIYIQKLVNYDYLSNYTEQQQQQENTTTLQSQIVQVQLYIQEQQQQVREVTSIQQVDFEYQVYFPILDTKSIKGVQIQCINWNKDSTKWEVNICRLSSVETQYIICACKNFGRFRVQQVNPLQQVNQNMRKEEEDLGDGLTYGGLFIGLNLLSLGILISRSSKYFGFREGTGRNTIHPLVSLYKVNSEQSPRIIRLLLLYNTIAAQGFSSITFYYIIKDSQTETDYTDILSQGMAVAWISSFIFNYILGFVKHVIIGKFSSKDTLLTFVVISITTLLILNIGCILFSAEITYDFGVQWILTTLFALLTDFILFDVFILLVCFCKENLIESFFAYRGFYINPSEFDVIETNDKDLPDFLKNID